MTQCLCILNARDYLAWADAEDDLSFWHERAVSSDFCQEGDKREPSRELVRRMIRLLDSSQPAWRDQMGENSFAIQLMDNCPEITRMA